MPAELFIRISLDQLYFPFLERLFDVIADCKAAGHQYYATMGFRTYAQQDALYAQGRTIPGAIVTAARGGQSAHNFGIAVDFTHDSDILKPGLQPDWDTKNYLPLGKAAKLRGLVWGGDWSKPDMPHVQWPTDLAPLKVAMDSGGLKAAWALL